MKRLRRNNLHISICVAKHARMLNAANHLSHAPSQETSEPSGGQQVQRRRKSASALESECMNNFFASDAFALVEFTAVSPFPALARGWYMNS